MAEAFNWVASLNVILQQSAVTNVTRELQQAFSHIKANVDVGISTSARAELDNLNKATTSLRSNLRAMADDASTRTSTAFRTMASAAHEGGNAFEAFGHQIRLATQRFGAFALGAGSVFGVLRGFKTAISDAIEFEKAMTRVAEVGNDTQATITGLGREIGKVSSQFGVSSQGLAEAALQFRQAGIQAKDLEQNLIAVSKASLVPGFGDLKQTTADAVTLFRQFGTAAGDMERSLSAVNNVASTFGVEAQDVFNGIGRVGSAAKNAGATLSETAALIGTLKKTTSESGEAIGSSLKAIFTRLENPSVIEHLRELGVELQNIDGQTVGPFQAIQRLSQAFAGIKNLGTDSRVAAVADELGVPRQHQKIIELLASQKSVQEAVNASQLSGIDITHSAERAQDSLAQQFARTKEELLQLGRSIYADNGIRTLLSDTLKLASALGSVADFARPLIPIIGTLGAIGLVKGIPSLLGGLGRGPTAKLASGGQVSGYGTGDRIPALLESGEWVIRKASVDKLGPGFMHAINSGRLPGFATGGEVAKGEVHSFSSFSDFGDFVASARSEAEKLKGVLSASTRVFAIFGDSGPVFKGFVDELKQATAAVASTRISLEPENYKATLATELVGTRASRANLIRKDFLDPNVAEQIGAGPVDKLTNLQQLAREKAALREQRVQALAGFYQQHEDLFDVVGDGPSPFQSRRRTDPASVATATRALVPFASRALVPVGAGQPPVDDGIIDADFTVRDQPTPLLGYRQPRGTSPARERRRALAEARALDQARFADATAQYQRAFVGPDDEKLFDRRNPAEAAYQRTTLGQVGFDTTGTLRDTISAREALRAQRAANARLDDPLARRAFLREQGIGLDEELRDEVFARRQARFTANATPAAAAGGSIFGGLAGLRQRFADTRIGQNFSNIGFIGASIAGSYAASGLQSYAGSAGDAVAGSGEGGFRGLRGAAGGIQTSLIGAAVGSAILPGIGTGVGAAIGAIAGFTSSLQEASKEIRDVKIGNSVATLSQNLGALAGPGASFATAQQARKSLETIKEEQTAKNRSEATGLLGSFDVKAFTGLQEKSARQNFGGQVSQITGYLNRQVEDLAKTVGVGAKELAERLHAGGNGLNAEFLSIIAGLKGTSIASVLKDYQKNIVDAQQASRLQQEKRTVQDEEDKALNNFARLSTAIQAAASGLDDLHAKSHAITDVFASRVGASPVTNLSDALAHPDKEFVDALGGVTAPFGSAGLRLRQSGGAAADLSRVIPAVLSQVLSQNPLDETDFASKTRSLTRSALGGQLSPEQSRGLEAVVSGLNQKKLPDIVREAGSDVSHFSQKLLDSFVGPIGEASQKIARELEKNATLFISELTAAAGRAKEIRDVQGRSDVIDLSSSRTAATFRADAAGRPSEALLRFLTLEETQRPFNQRQERLAGPSGLDPSALAGRLREIREQLGPATQRQQDTIRRFGAGPEVDAASSALIGLKDQASRVTEALGHLANNSERNSAAFERLNALQADKEGRLGYLRSYVLASPDERQQRERGLLLANQAASAGSLRGLLPDDQRLAIQTLDSLQGARLTGFPGQPIARDLADNLVKEFGGPGVAQDAGNRGEEDALKAAILEGNTQASESQAAFLDHLGELNKDAQAASRQLQQEFLSRLEQIMTRDAITQRTIEQGKAGADLGSLRNLAGQRDVLAGIGVTGDYDVEKLQSARQDIESLASGKGQGVAARQRLQESLSPDAIERLYQGVYGQIEGQTVKGRIFGRTAFDSQSKSELAALLQAQGFAGSDVAKIQQLFEQRTKEGVDREHPGALTPAGTEIGPAKAIFKASLRSALLEVGEEVAQRQGLDVVAAARQRIEAKGLDPRRIEGALGDDGSGAASLIKAISAFGGENRFSTLGARIDATTKSFDSLGEAIRNLQGNLGGQPERHAMGGPIGFGHGGHVNAMVMPGEFIFSPDQVNKIGINRLRQLNDHGAYSQGGYVPGVGSTDSVHASLPVGSFVLRKSVAQRMMAAGGEVQPDLADVYGAVGLEALRNPAGASGQSAFAITFQALNEKRLAKQPELFDGALALNEYANQSIAESRRERIAHYSDPLAAFGAGRVGGDAQRAISAGLAEARAHPELLKAGGRTGIAQTPSYPGYAEALQRGREKFAQKQKFAYDVDPRLLKRKPGGRPVLLEEGLNRLAEGGPVVDPSMFSTNSSTLNFRVGSSPDQSGIGAIGTSFAVPYSGRGEVPSVLHSGEYVLNRGATNAIGVRNLDKWNKLPRFESGGYVGSAAPSSPASAGGETSAALAGFGPAASQLSTAMGGFSQTGLALSQSFTRFDSTAATLADALKTFKGDLQIAGNQRVEVVVNGQDAFARMVPAISEMIQDKVSIAIRGLLKGKLQDA